MCVWGSDNEPKMFLSYSLVSDDVYILFEMYLNIFFNQSVNMMSCANIVANTVSVPMTFIVTMFPCDVNGCGSH